MIWAAVLLLCVLLALGAAMWIEAGDKGQESDNAPYWADESADAEGGLK